MRPLLFCEFAEEGGAQRAGNDVADAVARAATAGMLEKSCKPEAVIEGNFFSGGDIS